MTKEDAAIYKRGNKPVDPATNRQEKINAFKADQEVKRKLEVFYLFIVLFFKYYYY